MRSEMKGIKRITRKRVLAPMNTTTHSRAPVWFETLCPKHGRPEYQGAPKTIRVKPEPKKRIRLYGGCPRCGRE